MRTINYSLNKNLWNDSTIPSQNDNESNDDKLYFNTNKIIDNKTNDVTN